MTAASVAGWWLWYCGTDKRSGDYPVGSVLLPILIVTTILCRSTGAILLLAAGMIIFGYPSASRHGCYWPLSCVMGPLYVTVRSTHLWSGRQAVDLAEYLLDKRSFRLARISLHV